MDGADVFSCIIEMLAAAFRRTKRRGETREERRQRLLRDRRSRAIRRWLRRRKDGDPIPDLGLHCFTCGYCLTGLNSDMCPECSTEIDFSALD
jgi:rubrerythrin